MLFTTQAACKEIPSYSMNRATDFVPVYFQLIDHVKHPTFVLRFDMPELWAPINNSVVCILQTRENSPLLFHLKAS